MPAKKDSDIHPDQAAKALLSQIAQLCALADIPQDTAIAMFRSAYSKATEAPRSATKHHLEAFVAANVLTEWHTNERFCLTDGTPRPLLLKNGEFSDLCRAASVDADKTIILDLLLDAGAIAVINGSVTAKRRELILNYSHPAAVSRAIRLSTEYATTLYKNIEEPASNTKLFERAVVNTQLAAKHMPSLLAYLSTQGQSFLEDLDSWMSVREDPNNETTIGVGVYVFLKE